jgi:hypothetical protein
MHRVLLSAVVLLASPTAASAQSAVADIIGQTIGNAVAGDSVAPRRELRCLAGEFQASARELEAIRAGAHTTMTNYFARVSASNAADVSDLFSRRQQLWRRISEERKDQDLRVVDDPFARAGTTVLSLTDDVFRSGDGRTAAGLWVVTDAANSERIVGTYRATFRREGGRWKILTLELADPDDPISLWPYCHGLGDVEARSAELAAEAAAHAALESGNSPAGQTDEAPVEPEGGTADSP